jgi:hypothetical protein
MADEAPGQAPAGTDPATQTTPPAGEQTPPVPAPPAQPPAAPAEPNAEPSGERYDDPEWTRNEIARLRRERGDERIAAKNAAADEARKEVLQALTVALGGQAPGEGDAPPTVESLTSQVATVTDERDTARAETTAVQREFEIWKSAAAAQIAPSQMDYLAFRLSKRADIADIKPDDPSFGATLTAAIQDEVAKNPSLKASGAYTGTGGPGFSGTDGAGQMTKADFDALPYVKKVEIYNSNRAEYDRLVNG